MRLLNAREFRLQLFQKELPPYAILSHRWTESESCLQDIECGSASDKIRGFAHYVDSHFALEWIWVDSCCIDQKSAAELSEGVNCMFEWYRNARICIAYLADVKHPSDQLAFRKSVWFTRGWTLQELVASTIVVFVTETWEVIGHKGNADYLRASFEAGPNLEPMISEVTGIPRAVLQDFSNSHALSVEQRMRWMEGRETLKEEDLSYALFGIFGVTPGANYGEKKAGAAQRLKEAIVRKQHSNNDSLPTRIALPATLPQHSIPFTRDPAFVERSEMKVIQERLRKPGARIVLVGLGGIGKSQLAIEQCYRMMDDLPNTWVLWLHASSAARFDQEVSNLLDELNIPGRQDKDANVFQLFRGWLRDGSRHWLIVLDNADDADFLFASPECGRPSTKARIDYIPVCLHGSLLATTRIQAIARRLTSDEAIVLGPERALAIELLRTKLGLSEATAEVTKLAVALDYIPLAIAQAAAYIKQRRPRCTVVDYLSKLEKSERSRSSLLKVKSEELRRDRQEAENSILLTWQISFEHLRATRKSAADMLSLMSFYDHQGIPDFLLKGDLESDNEHDEGSDSTSDHSIEEAFEADIIILRDYSFISVTDGCTLQMHRLVQLAAQFWLRERTKQFEKYQAKSLHKLDRLYPNPHFEWWKQCRALQTHAKFMYNVKAKENVAILSRASIMYKAAWFAISQGLHTEAETLAARSLRDREEVLGKNHSDTLSSMADLASVYRSQGRWKEAEELNVKALEARIKVLGEEHPDTLMTMSNLASTYRNQGRWKESEELEVKALETRKKVLGEEHPDTLVSVNNLAATYYDQDRLHDAWRLTKDCLRLRTTVLGATHPDTLTSAGWLKEIEAQMQTTGSQETGARTVDPAADST